MLIVTIAMTYEPSEKQEPKSTNTMKEPTDEIHASMKLEGEKREEKGVKEGTKVRRCFSCGTRTDEMAASGYVLCTRCGQTGRS